MKTFTIVFIAVVAGIFAYAQLSPQFLGNAITQGIVPTVSSDASVAVGPQQVITVASKASNCVSRVISTASTSLMLSFSTTFTPTATVGHYQAASTTVSYDNANFGCGPIRAWANASGTVAVASVIQ